MTMTLAKVCIALMVVVGSFGALPSTFDIRFQPDSAIYANYNAAPITTCAAYDWALTLSQTLANAASISMKSKISLSAQQIAECITNLDDICKQIEAEDIKAGLKYINEKGITESDCYLNKLYERPGQFCKRNCEDGSSFVRNFKALVTTETDVESLLLKVGNGLASGLALIKVYESMNYYSAFSPQNMKKGGDMFGYTLGQIVGWRNEGKQITVRMGSAGWGYKGYGYIGVDSGLIEQMYSLTFLGYHNSQVEE